MKINFISSEARIIASVAAIWIIFMSQFKPLIDPAVWLAPSCIVGVYLIFVLWRNLIKTSLSPAKKRNQEPSAFKPTLMQYAVQCAIYSVLFICTTAVLKAGFDWFNNWHIAGVGLVCFCAVTWAFEGYVWRKSTDHRSQSNDRAKS